MTALIMLVAGVAMIITSDTLASAHIVVGGGILFILAGIANMLFFLGARVGVFFFFFLWGRATHFFFFRGAPAIATDTSAPAPSGVR